MLQSTAIKFNDDYVVFWKVEDVPSIPGTYSLTIVSRQFVKDKWQDSKNEIFLDTDKLQMICSLFDGVRNDLNKL